MIILYIAAAYLILGILFAIPFLLRWITTVDESATGTSWKFRLTILPGCIVFWPVLMKKYITLRKGN